MPLVSPEKIDQILNAADIVEVIGEYVQLVPAGKNFKGLCPFHNEKTASFFVSKERHSFTCFGCGEKGNAAMFLQKYKSLTFVEALKTLADRYHVEFDYETRSAPDEKMGRFYEITEAADRYYQLSLTNLASGKPALDYLKKRGLDLKTIQYFELGFAPGNFDSLYQTLKGKYQEMDLLELGLIKKTAEGSYFDLFRDRVIFPIRNENGKVVGYSGRLYETKDNEPKYVNSPFTTIFTKGQILYNLDKAQPAIKSSKRVLLYEGFMDVIASVASGVKDAVASMGTNLTPDQAHLLRKFAEKVVLCYDGDSAGFEAMNRAVSLLEEAGLQVAMLILPEELDPDDYVRKYGTAEYARYVETKQIDKYEFRYQYLKKHADFGKAAEVERFKIALFTYLIQEASGTVTEIYLNHFARDAKVAPETVKSDLIDFRVSRAITEHQAEKKGRPIGPILLNKYYKAELILVSYYARSLDYRTILRERLSDSFCQDGLNQQILYCINDLEENGVDSDLREYVPAKFPGKEAEIARILTFKMDDFGVQELEDCIRTINIRTIENRIRDLRNRQGLVDQMGDRREFDRIQKEITELKVKEETINGPKRNRQKID